MESEIKLSKPEDISELARKVIARLLSAPKNGAAVLALSGELGAGKTTLTQAIAKELGVIDVVPSPTFTIYRRYKIPDGSAFSQIFHFDLYRLSGESDLVAVGWRDALATSNALVIVEWPERAQAEIPKSAIWLKLRHGNTPIERIATFGAGE